MPLVRTNDRSGGRSVYGHVITKFSRMGRLLNCLGARLATWLTQIFERTKTCNDLRFVYEETLRIVQVFELQTVLQSITEFARLRVNGLYK